MTNRADKRREEKRRNRLNENYTNNTITNAEIASKTAEETAHHAKDKRPIWQKVYEDHYKLLMLIPLTMVLLAFVQIGFQTYTTGGDFINKDISLKGGVGITFQYNEEVNTEMLEKHLAEKGFSTSVRDLQTSGKPVAFTVQADIDMNDKQKREELITAIGEKVNIEGKEFSVEGIGSKIGSSFFRQAIMALIASFILMGIVVFISFRPNYIASAAVMLAGFSDIIVTIAIVNILGIKISTAGIAGLLMLIGYSVDTDILLTSRVLKRTEDTLMKRIYHAIKTGLLMNAATLVVVIIGFMLTSSEVIKQIMTIIMIGIIVDQFMTWIQNVGILRLYFEHQEKKNKK